MEKINRYQYLVRIIPQFVDVNGELTALDVGCGSGRMLKHMVTYFPHWKLYGVDVTEERCKLAMLSCPAAEVQQGSVTTLQFEDEVSNLTVCSDVLEHIWDREHRKAAGELQRVTKSGGLLIVSTPALQHPERRMLSLGHVSYLDLGLLQALFADCAMIHESQICKSVPEDPTQIVIFRKR